MSSTAQPDPSKNLNEFNKFLENNVDFLKQKYAEHFIESFSFVQLQTKSKIQLGIKFIYDVFSFEKYQKDQKMNLTLRRSLRENILSFIKVESPQQGRKFTPEDGIKLLKYCIENNEMFAVHYDKKEKQKSPTKPSQEKDPNSQHNNQQQPQIQRTQQNPTNQQPTQILQKNQSHLSQRSHQSITQPIQSVSSQKKHQFSMVSKSEEQKKHNQILKKEAKVVFDFYCKQQLCSGAPNSTFDKISHQANTMTLGKFMAFANSSSILYTNKLQAHRPKDQKVLDKKTINECFRKISKAQKEIHFQQFFELIKTLNHLDNTVYQKLNMNKSQTHNKILRKLKYLNTPFSMKGHLQEDSHFIINQKPYIPINTAHSGRFQSSLKEDIEQRRQKLRFLPHQPYPNPNPIKGNDTFIVESQLRQSFIEQQLMESKVNVGNGFLLNRRGESKTTTDNKQQASKIRLQNSRISFQNGNKFRQQINLLQGLIVEDDDNDDVFLKDYKIPKLGSNAGLKKRSIHKLSMSNRNSEEGGQSGRKFSGMKSVRKNVVDELKQRIMQVERSQRKQLTGVQNRRKVISNQNNNKY